VIGRNVRFEIERAEELVRVAALLTHHDETPLVNDLISQT
jgi:hypothetical protein